MGKVLCAFLILCLTALGNIAKCNVVVCEGQKGYLTCPSGQSLSIQSAIYGRLQDGTVCPHHAIRTASCRSSSSDQIVKNECNGKNRCQVEASNGVFGGDPCWGTYKYLNVSYKCY